MIFYNISGIIGVTPERGTAMLRKVLSSALAVAAFTVFAFDPTTYVSVGVGGPDTLDIHQAYDTASGEIIYNVYEGLIAYK